MTFAAGRERSSARQAQRLLRGCIAEEDSAMSHGDSRERAWLRPMTWPTWASAFWQLVHRPHGWAESSAVRNGDGIIWPRVAS